MVSLSAAVDLAGMAPSWDRSPDAHLISDGLGHRGPPPTPCRTPMRGRALRQVAKHSEPSMLMKANSGPDHYTASGSQSNGASFSAVHMVPSASLAIVAVWPSQCPGPV